MRPAIPGYALASDILQRHVSACLAGLATAENSLASAAKETRLLLGRPR
jgi:multiple sugar transport system substrate-binding protein